MTGAVWTDLTALAGDPGIISFVVGLPAVDQLTAQITITALSATIGEVALSMDLDAATAPSFGASAVYAEIPDTGNRYSVTSTHELNIDFPVGIGFHTINPIYQTSVAMTFNFSANQSLFSLIIHR